VNCSRRQLGSFALSALSGLTLLRQGPWSSVAAQLPSSKALGVRFSVISYSFRQISYNPEDVVKGMLYLGLDDLELEQSFFEPYLGAPRDPTGGGQPAGVGTVPPGGPFGDTATNPPAAGPGGGRGPAGSTAGRGRRGEPLTPAEEARRASARAELRKWRMSPPTAKIRALRAMFDEAKISVSLVKFPQLGGVEMTDEEIHYCFQFAKAMGARALTCEPPLSQTKRLAKFADQHDMVVGFHNHSNVTSVEAFGRTGAWEQAFFYSPKFWANVDVGHFTAGNGFPPTEFIREYHHRITSLHLKDRKINGPNVPWGQGDTPLTEILRLLKRERYNIPATIELEYPIPEGSTVMDELARCVKFCRDAVA
jgi:sugar phosphate isomerase/epimerase